MASYAFLVIYDPSVDLDNDAQVQAYFERKTKLDISQLGIEPNEMLILNFVTDSGARRGERYFIVHKGKLLGVEE